MHCVVSLKNARGVGAISEMVGIDDLAMLDLQLWLRSGEAAATRLHCAQSTISRRNGETLRCFDLTMVRDSGEWQ